MRATQRANIFVMTHEHSWRPVKPEIVANVPRLRREGLMAPVATTGVLWIVLCDCGAFGWQWGYPKVGDRITGQVYRRSERLPV